MWILLLTISYFDADGLRYDKATIRTVEVSSHQVCERERKLSVLRFKKQAAVFTIGYRLSATCVKVNPVELGQLK